MARNLRTWVQNTVVKCINSQSEAVWFSKPFGFCSVDDFVNAFGFDTSRRSHTLSSCDNKGKKKKKSTRETRKIVLNVLQDKAELNGICAIQEISGNVALVLMSNWNIFARLHTRTYIGLGYHTSAWAKSHSGNANCLVALVLTHTYKPQVPGVSCEESKLSIAFCTGVCTATPSKTPSYANLAFKTGNKFGSDKRTVAAFEGIETGSKVVKLALAISARVDLLGYDAIVLMFVL